MIFSQNVGSPKLLMIFCVKTNNLENLLSENAFKKFAKNFIEHRAEIFYESDVKQSAAINVMCN